MIHISHFLESHTCIVRYTTHASLSSILHSTTVNYLYVHVDIAGPLYNIVQTRLFTTFHNNINQANYVLIICSYIWIRQNFGAQICLYIAPAVVTRVPKVDARKVDYVAPTTVDAAA